MIQELIKLGFSENESKIYLELLKNKDSQAGILSKKTGINRRTTYDSLQRLIEKGYVGFNISANKKVFYAMNPDVIISNIDEMKDEAARLLPKLIELNREMQQENTVVIYKTRKGIRNILKLILKSKEYVSFGSSDQFPRLMKYDYELFQYQKNKLRIRTRTILGEDVRGMNILKTAKPATEFKFLHAKLAGPTSTFIFSNKVAIIIWEEPLFAVLIESKTVYDSYREYFEELWKTAQR